MTSREKNRKDEHGNSRAVLSRDVLLRAYEIFLENKAREHLEFVKEDYERSDRHGVSRRSNSMTIAWNIYNATASAVTHYLKQVGESSGIPLDVITSNLSDSPSYRIWMNMIEEMIPERRES